MEFDKNHYARKLQQIAKKLNIKQPIVNIQELKEETFKEL